MLNIGLQITKNKDKYLKLLEYFKNNFKYENKVRFINIQTDSNIIDHIKDLHVLLCYQIKKDFFVKASPSLKWIHIGGAGVENSLIPEVINSKVVISNSSGIHADPVSEYVFTAMLYFSKMLNELNIFKKTKVWTQWEIAKKSIQLKGKTIGIIGYGNIGKAIAKKAKAFNMNVIATRRLQKKVESNRFVDKLIPMLDLELLLSQSDFIIISCPLTPQTKNLIKRDQLKIMKNDSIIINIARGEIINEEDLIFALKKDVIGGAALDVYSKEPLDPNSDIFACNNILLSPHVSGNYKNYQRDMIKLFSENLEKYIEGKNLKNRVCKKRLY